MHKGIADKFQLHVQPKSNPVFSRYKFNNERQGENSMETFITRLKVLANDCAFGAEYKDDMIRDRIVFGISSDKIREKLITEGEQLTLEKAVQICQSYEYAQSQLREMKSNDKSVDALRKSSQQKQKTGIPSGNHRHSTSSRPQAFHPKPETLARANRGEPTTIEGNQPTLSHTSVEVAVDRNIPKDSVRPRANNAITVTNGTISLQCAGQKPSTTLTSMSIVTKVTKPQMFL